MKNLWFADDGVKDDDGSHGRSEWGDNKINYIKFSTFVQVIHPNCKIHV